jgi:hypothetical protein
MKTGEVAGAAMDSDEPPWRAREVELGTAAISAA